MGFLFKVKDLYNSSVIHSLIETILFLIKLIVYTAGSWETIGSFFVGFRKGIKRKSNKSEDLKDFKSNKE